MDGLISVNVEYSEWIKTVSRNFKQCQIKAASKVNEEMLRFYWQIGKELISLKTKSNLGNKFYGIVSKDLKKELPEVKSFSPTNLKYMQYFYELYASPQVVDSNENELSPQVVDLNEVIFKIPWGHHRYIIDKCKDNRQNISIHDNAIQIVRHCQNCSISQNILHRYTAYPHRIYCHLVP